MQQKTSVLIEEVWRQVGQVDLLHVKVQRDLDDNVRVLLDVVSSKLNDARDLLVSCHRAQKKAEKVGVPIPPSSGRTCIVCDDSEDPSRPSFVAYKGDKDGICQWDATNDLKKHKRPDYEAALQGEGWTVVPHNMDRAERAMET